MFCREIRKVVPSDLNLGADNTLEAVAVHFTNKVVLKLRFNGELDTCYEILSKGLPAEGLGSTPLGKVVLNSGIGPEDEDFEDLSPIEDGLSNFHVTTRLGNSNDMKLPIVCTQIAEMYQKAVLPSNIDGLRDIAPSRDFVVSLSAKMWKRDTSETDFALLVFILQTIKEMYNS
ncbi:Irc25p [Lachancea thermotolerans CBS 6340]|uniref:KLTH0B03454p n=1 Tax=Lachancea thermotolerans (strain ATCC 56472 / CBS 6340 / NRRL Y-8284) TaxID=559295 RepID=C5DCJ0_LACTC|nr:KLTH0B03454p [Lachancea thermotolerans CBS 6340]CAR21501.1 KLTH0B03454p [Lachancea thermotolerans CBS 6340]